MKLTKSYALFYALGREDKTLKNDVDTEAIAEKVIAGDGSPYELCLEAATDTAKPLQADRKRRVWFEEHSEEITSAGGDKDEAYKHYCQGRIDELAGELEAEVAADLIAIVLGDEDEDDDEDDDDEDEQGGES